MRLHSGCRSRPECASNNGVPCHSFPCLPQNKSGDVGPSDVQLKSTDTSDHLFFGESFEVREHTVNMKFNVFIQLLKRFILVTFFTFLKF